MTTGDRSTIIFVGAITADQAKAVKALEETLCRPVRPVLFFNIHSDEVLQIPVEVADQVVVCPVDFNNPVRIAKAIKPFADDVMAVACKDDESASGICLLAPYLHDVPMPSVESLLWSTNKTLMRAMFHVYDESLSPKFTTATDSSAETIRRVERIVGYPLIVKPASLTSSLLVTACYNREQLTEAFQHIIKYSVKSGKLRPQVLVEQLMEEGSCYSVDVYVSPKGAMQFTPPVHYTTGRDIGFDDFFGYIRSTSVDLSPVQIKSCKRTASEAVKALQLTATTCHVELMLTPEGWKIIEVGPRLGGFRHELYNMAYGINHALNDLLVRSGRSPIVSDTSVGYAAAIQFYAREEGTLQKIQGLETVKRISSLQRLGIFKKAGDMCTFAKHGGRPVLEAVLYNEDEKRLRADICAIEDNLDIKTDDTAEFRDRRLSPRKIVA